MAKPENVRGKSFPNVSLTFNLLPIIYVDGCAHEQEM